MVNRRTWRIGGFIPALLMGVGLGCDADPKGPGGNRGMELLVYRGDGQVGEVGNQLPLPLAIRVIDDRGRGVSDVLIRWEALEPGGAVTLAIAPSVTNGFGVAEVGRTLGPLAGIHETVASLGDGAEGEVRFTSVGQVQGVMRLVQASEGHGDGQADTVLATLEPHRVVALDYLDAPVAGAEVRWVLSGGGSLSAQSSVTDEHGIAETRYTLGPVAPQSATVTARMWGLPEFVSFQAETLPGNPVAIAAGTGQAQLGVRDTPLYEPYRVHATDAHGNTAAAEGIVIDWTVTAGGGAIEPAQTILDGSPDDEEETAAGALHTLGPDEGIHTVTATAGGLPGASEVTFEARAVSSRVDLLQEPDPNYWCLYYGSEFCPHLFSPDSVAVQAGESVGWDWSGVVHSVVFEDHPSPPVSSVELHRRRHLRTFDAPGTYRYRCTVHSSDFEDGMVGRVIVH